MKTYSEVILGTGIDSQLESQSLTESKLESQPARDLDNKSESKIKSHYHSESESNSEFLSLTQSE